MTYNPPPAKSMGKIIKYSPYNEEGSEKLYLLTERMTGLLLTMTEYLRWGARYDNFVSELDTADKRDEYTSNLELRLMRNVDFCTEVLNCLDTSEDVQTEIHRAVTQASGHGNAGTSSTVEEQLEDIAAETNPTCDLDILWAQCLFVVTETHARINDTLQVFETYTNINEFITAGINAIPILGDVIQATGLDGVQDLFEYYTEAIADNYAAAYTESVGGTRDEIAYQLFCRCRHDCTITIERIYKTMKKRVEQFIVAPAFVQLNNFLGALANVDQSEGTLVLDLAFYAAWSFVRNLNYFFADYYDAKLFNILLALAANTPNSGWIDMEAIFDDCIDCFDTEFDEYLTVQQGTLIATEAELDYVRYTAQWGFAECTLDFGQQVSLVSGFMETRQYQEGFHENEYYAEMFDGETSLGYSVSWYNTSDGGYEFYRDYFGTAPGTLFTKIVFKKRSNTATLSANDVRFSVCVTGL